MNLTFCKLFGSSFLSFWKKKRSEKTKEEKQSQEKKKVIPSDYQKLCSKAMRKNELEKKNKNGIKNAILRKVKQPQSR